MQELLPEFERAGATLIAVSPDAAEHLEGMAEAKGLTFPVLHDPDLSVARSYGLAYELSEELDGLHQGFGINLVERNEMASSQLPVPASYVIGSDGVVQFAFIEEDHTMRPEPAELLAAVQGIG